MTRYAAHLKSLFRDEIEGWIARALPLIIRRSLQNGLHGVWAKGDWEALPSGGFIIAANHHSWWDGYLLWLVKKRTKRRVCLLMEGRQLERFRFFRRWGAVDRGEVREALRRLKRGDLLLIFPEGRLEPPGPLANVHRGLSFLATHAQAPVYPLALRVAVRGAQHPEAFVVLGQRLEPHKALPQTYKEEVNTLLSGLDTFIARAESEAPPEGFEAWLSGKRSFHTRMGWVARLWS